MDRSTIRPAFCFIRSIFDLSVNSTVEIYHGNYELWNTFPIGVGDHLLVLDASTSTFDEDPATGEILGLTLTDQGNALHVFRPDGLALFSIDSSLYGDVSRLPGRAPKLIVSRSNAGSIHVRVYGTGMSAAHEVPGQNAGNFAVMAVPNPATAPVQLDLSSVRDKAAVVTIIDARGHVMLRQRFAAAPALLRLDTQSWPNGVYMISVAAAGQHGTGRLVRH